MRGEEDIPLGVSLDSGERTASRPHRYFAFYSVFNIRNGRFICSHAKSNTHDRSPMPLIPLTSQRAHGAAQNQVVHKAPNPRATDSTFPADFPPHWRKAESLGLGNWIISGDASSYGFRSETSRETGNATPKKASGGGAYSSFRAFFC